MCVYIHTHKKACESTALTIVYPDKLQRLFPVDLQSHFLWGHTAHKSQLEGAKPGQGWALLNVKGAWRQAKMSKGVDSYVKAPTALIKCLSKVSED